MKLSIILPCYKVEKYIAECLDSLYAQDIPESEYEAICVNDCSPDGTRDIVVAYQQLHPNLILIDHEVNKRQGGARNTGIKAAKGEYIWFVDPDDYIKPNVLNSLLSICFENKLDIFQFNYEKVTIDGVFQFKKENVGNTTVTSGIEFVNSLGEGYLNDYDLSVCTRFIKSEFLNNNNIQFIENTILEDLEFSLRTIMFSNRMHANSGSFYCYRSNPESTMSDLHKSIKGNFIFQTSLIIGNGIVKLANDLIDIDIKNSRKLYEAGIWRINQITKPLLKASKKERSIFYDLIQNDNELKNKIVPYLNPINRLLINHEKTSKFLIASFISPAYNLIRKK